MGYFLGEVDGTRSVLDALIKHQTAFTEVHRVTLQFYALSDDLSSSEYSVKNQTPGLPVLWETYSPTMVQELLMPVVCVNVEGREVNRIARHPITGVPCVLWIFSCEFSDEVDLYQAEQAVFDSPSTKTAETWWESEIVTEVTNILPNGEILMTSAGEPLYYERKIECALLRVQQWEPTPFDYNLIIRFNNAINRNVFLDAPIGTVKMKKIATQEETIGGVVYVKMDYQLLFRLEEVEDPNGEPTGDYYSNTWVEEVLNCGHWYIDRVSGERRLHKVGGDPAKVNLNDEGWALLPEEVGEETYITLQPKFRDFNEILSRWRLP